MSLYVTGPLAAGVVHTTYWKQAQALTKPSRLHPDPTLGLAPALRTTA
jgi:hypothetical protein